MEVDRGGEKTVELAGLKTRSSGETVRNEKKDKDLAVGEEELQFDFQSCGQRRTKD